MYHLNLVSLIIRPAPAAAPVSLWFCRFAPVGACIYSFQKRSAAHA
jgi:hypothetical protein